MLQVLVPVGCVRAAGLDKLEGRRGLERDLDTGGRGDRAVGANTIRAYSVVVAIAVAVAIAITIVGVGVVST